MVVKAGTNPQFMEADWVAVNSSGSATKTINMPANGGYLTLRLANGDGVSPQYSYINWEGYIPFADATEVPAP